MVCCHTAPYPLAAGIEQGLARDFTGDPLAEDVHLHGRAESNVSRQIGIGNRALNGIAEAAAGDAATDLAVDSNRLVAERDRARVREHDAAQPPLRLGQRLRADERPLPAHGESKPALERG